MNKTLLITILFLALLAVVIALAGNRDAGVWPRTASYHDNGFERNVP